MKATIITDKEHQTDLFKKLQEQTINFFIEKNFQTELICIGRDDLTYCMGCFGCWVKKPGECVISDMMTKINYDYINSDVVIYLTPVIFGQFSANIKNAIDRSLPNMLPFFETRPDGSTMHTPRYESYPKQIIVGYGDNLDEEDQKLFIDITKKHRNNIEVFIYQNEGNNIHRVFDSIELQRVGGHL
jgi:multimeric flavodoxin WrbA